MTGTKWATATATAVLLVATQAQAITDADKCEAAKNKVSGKYLLCRLKADAKAAQTGAPADYLKCSMKFDEKWDLAETKYGASCPDTVGASGPMDALLTSQATRVAAIVAGTQDIATCGNGILDPGEECDDGNLDNADGCSGAGSPLGACQVERCGDGVVNNGEPCDPLDTPATCNLDCSLSVCGDGKVNPSAVPPEQCDDWNNNPGDGCHECRIERCGNGVLDQGEECDGVVNAGAFGCSPECFQIQCGNGRLDAGEQCDDGNNSDTDSCLSSDPDPSTCRAARCGDGFVWAGVEQCDDGAPNTYTDACLPSCQLNVCGDGFLKTTGSNPEACDDGNIVLETGCPYGTPTCVGCTEDCSSVTDLHGPFCGDGNVDVGYGEECDDGNNTSGDGCSATCQLEF